MLIQDHLEGSGPGQDFVSEDDRLFNVVDDSMRGLVGDLEFVPPALAECSRTLRMDAGRAMTLPGKSERSKGEP